MRSRSNEKRVRETTAMRESGERGQKGAKIAYILFQNFPSNALPRKFHVWNNGWKYGDDEKVLHSGQNHYKKCFAEMMRGVVLNSLLINDDRFNSDLQLKFVMNKFYIFKFFLN